MRLAAFVAFLFISVAARSAEPVPEFEQLVARASKATDGAQWVYRDGSGKWRRGQAVVSGLAYDVRKTDSLIAPIVGDVKFTMRTRASGPYETEDAARASTDFAQVPDALYEFTLAYHWRDGSWRFASGKRLSWFDDPKLGKAGRAALDLTDRDIANPRPDPLGFWIR